MKNIFINLKDAIKFIISDPMNIFLAIIPALIALILYVLGVWFILDHTEYLSRLLNDYMSSSQQIVWVTRILTVIFVISFFFIISWTFLIVVELISFPFNTLLSSRIEKKIINSHQLKTKMSFFSMLRNEIKKIFFLFFLTLLSFFMNLVPILYPISFILISLLLAIQFLDYSWSRHELSFSECLKDVMKNFLSYTLGGAIFLGMISVPLVNIFVPALATSYFTVSWLRASKNK